MSSPRRIFLDWNRPALDRAVELLTADWTTGPLDLRSTLLIVPTRHAGRRLRERLALAAAQRNTGVLIGRVETPSFLFEPPPDPAPLATSAASDLFWRRTLQQADASTLASLGRAATATDPALRAATAAHLRTLRDSLIEEGHDLSTFADLLHQHHPAEDERWAALATLEALYTRILQDAGWRDEASAKRTTATSPEHPEGTRRVVILFTPDPPPLALRRLATWAAHLPITIVLHAPASAAHRFDAWGRPLPDAWTTTPLSLDPDLIEVCDDAITVAERIRVLVTALDPPARRQLVTGIGDPLTATRISMTLAREGIGTFNPAGTPAARLYVFKLVDLLLALHQDDTIDAFNALVRHPAPLAILHDATADENLLARLDAFIAHHMPGTLHGARDALDRSPLDFSHHHNPAERERARTILRHAFEIVQRWRTTLRSGPLAQTLPSLLAELFTGVPSDHNLEKQARLLNDALTRFATLEPLCHDPGEAVEILRLILAGLTLATPRHDEDLDVLGWLELPWEDAPLLLLTDLNDGIIPEAPGVDAFLPDHARTATGLRDNRARLARDAFMLEGLVCSRAPGNLRGFMPRRNTRGDHLKPSRLLFMGEPADLPRRALHFFAEGRPAFRSAVRKPTWLLRGPEPQSALASLQQLSVSSLKTYLRCPFAFYLQKALKLGDPFDYRQELDARDFGSFVHEIMRVFATGPHANSHDPDAIERVLHAEADHQLTLRFGTPLPLAISLQRDVLLQRLTYAARKQAQWRQAGWILDPILSEKPFTLPLGPFVITARIDRIDRHEHTREICVMDYKTSAQATPPAKAHIANPKAAPPPEMTYAAVPSGGTWTDLQLPVYAAIARTLFPDENQRIHSAYFVLPNAVSETDILTWDTLNNDLIQSALATAHEIFNRARAGVFWPPRVAYTQRDNAYPLFFDDLAAHLDPTFRTALQTAANAYPPPSPLTPPPSSLTH